MEDAIKRCPHCGALERRMTKKEIINELIENPEYKSNLYEILDAFFGGNAIALQEWDDWFFGVQDVRMPMNY